MSAAASPRPTASARAGILDAAAASPLRPEDALPPPRRDRPRATRVLVDPDTHRLTVQRLVLRAMAGEDTGGVFQADGDRLVVGTHPSADARLADPTVSGFHCEVAVRDGAVLVRDLGSRNGTWVDGVSVLEAHLRPGAVLGVGRSQLRFEVGDDSVDIPLASGGRFGSMVGSSREMRRAFERLALAARSDATVLLGGETGTGKEAAAESIHRESARADGRHSMPPTAGGPAVDLGQPYKEAKEAWVRDFEREYLARMLEAHDGNVRAAARAAELDRVYFYRLLWKNGLK